VTAEPAAPPAPIIIPTVAVPVVQAPPLPPPAPPPPPPVVKKQRPKVEVVFVLDTTGSMGGLIEGAKQKIWSIANHIASGQPTPDVKIGLVAYRDIGDAYVTKDFALSGDLDTVYEHLQGFQAAGGGDTPEHVNKALFDAVHKMQWSPDAMKMIFLVGDAPPHMDYGDGFDYHKIVREAAHQEIAVHAVRCGNDPNTAAAWKEIAELGHGTYASIAQGGGVAVISTPMDADLARLSRELDETSTIYGGGEARARYESKMSAAAGAPATAAADRGGYYAKTHAGLDKDDVTEKVAKGEMDASKLDEEKLPEEMRNKTAEERKELIVAKQKQRERVLKEMNEVSARRDAYLRAESKKGGHADGFDDVVDGAITEQGKAYGVAF
jgi:hypothetical protein